MAEKPIPKPRRSRLMKGESISFSVRRISNGYVVTKTTETKKANGNIDFDTTETFSESVPDLAEF